jgi:hypothetical protein
MLGRHGLVLDQCLGYLDRRETRRWETLSRMTGGLLYSLFGGGARPIEIQRKLGARRLQNRRGLPQAVAWPIGRAMRAGLPHAAEPGWTELDAASCLLVEGHRG